MKDRAVLALVFGLTAVVLAVVVALRFIERPDDVPDWATRLPALNACINGVCTALLLAARRAIRRGRADLHKQLNLATFALSCVFLLSYVTYHAVAPETRYPAESPWRPVYLAVLLSHILLAAVVLPLVLLSFWQALRGNLAAHRRLVRWSWPVWVYVTATGVAVYLMIAPHYPF